MSRSFRVLSVLLASGGIFGCGDNQSAPLVADDPRRNVMVIDYGFDLTVAGFRGKVTAAYSVVCDADSSDGEPAVSQPDNADGGSGVGDAGLDGAPTDTNDTPDFSTLKTALIEELAHADTTCHLQEGISAKVPFGQGWEAERDRWNGDLLHDRNPFTSGTGVSDYLEEQLNELPFHGTATAATIVFKTKDVKLVLIEDFLPSAEQVKAAVVCPTQADLDLAAKLLSDPDVRTAYLARPLSTVEREISELRTARGVGLVNESFGRPSRYGYERLFFEAGCGDLNVDDYYQSLAVLLRGVDAAHVAPSVLTVRAAGNEGAALNTPEDGIQCHPGDVHQLLIGSYGTDGERSSFSNFGKCVDANALGEFVVVPVPGDWLMPLSGTSFAAPLALRTLLFAAPTPFSPASARAALIDLALPNKNLPVSLFPREQVFDVWAARRQALSSSPKGETATPAMRAGHDMMTARALREISWPVRWTSRLSGRKPLAETR